MKDQIIMSKVTGDLGIAIPLFRVVDADTVDMVGKWVICFNTMRPLAYVVDDGEDFPIIINAKFVEKYSWFLGDV